MPPPPHPVRTRWTQLALLAGLLLSAGVYYLSRLDEKTENLHTSIETSPRPTTRAPARTSEMMEQLRKSSEVKELIAVPIKASSPLSPKQLELAEAAIRSSLDSRYGELLRSLALSDSDMEKFREFLVMRTLLLDSAIRKLDPALHKMAEIRIPTGWDPASNAMAQRNLTVEYGDKTVLNATITAVSNLADDSIHPLLGDENYAKYKFYQDTLIFRAALGRLTFALDSTQTDQLLTLLAASNPPYPEPTQPMVNADVLAKASDFLTPTQISSLKPVAEKQARDAALISEALSKLEN